MQTIYRPGTWYLIMIPGALVALPPDVPGEVVGQLWDRLPAQKTLATVVDVLTTQAGGSFTALPPFVAAVAEGSDVRIALRGGVVARVTTESGESQEVSGADVTTWSERFVGGARRIEITVEETTSGAALPAQSGIVCAAAVSAELEPGDAAPLTQSLGPVPRVDTAAVGVSAAVLSSVVPALVDFGAPTAAGASGHAFSGVAPVPISAVPVLDEVPVPVPDAVPVADAVADAPSEVVTDAIAEVPAEAEPEEEPEAEPEIEPEPEPLPVIDSTLSAAELTLAPPVDDDFDQLWGATVHSVPAAPTAPPAPPAAFAGDHDGATISAAELRAMRQQPPIANDVPTAVLPVTDAPLAGRIRVSTGQVVALDRTVIIGRRPRSTRASGANLPHLVAVESPQQDISRSHLEVRPEGDTVVVIDLHTTNGSTLLRPGADPMRLHPGEQTLVLSGDVVDLGDGVTVAFEDLP
ncbi:MAG: FHA domain-containing protein [Candidatus Microbacterium colombiense]|nr:MAG: FHA domain-containing protein [Microbacterium sp.]